MNQNPVILKNRAIISISGDDRHNFLQGLITNDVKKVGENQAIYSLMLNAQGRFLYDFFIIEKDQKLFLDCARDKADEIVKKLSFYKLRSKIEIAKENFLVAFALEPLVVSQDFVAQFADPRNSEMGYRFMINQLATHNLQLATNNQYDLLRINLKIPDDSDLVFDKSFPLEFGFDDLNAIDYKKGCYIGQETTARMHYKSVIRKKIFLAEIIEAQEISKGIEIKAFGPDGEKKIGEILSSILYQNQLLSLVLIKNIDNEDKEINFEQIKLTASGKEIKLIK